MDLEQALAIANQAVYAQMGRSLSDVEQLIFTGAWQGQTYEQIAEINGYSAKYLKDDSGRKFWKLLSQVLGETVSKNNFRAAILRRRDSVNERLNQRQEQQKKNEQSQPREVATITQPRSSSVQADWGEVIDVSQFYGRSGELTTLMQWVMNDRCRLIALLGMGGIGKTALSVKLANQLLITSSIQGRHEFEFVIWRSLRNAPPLEDLLAGLVPFLSNQQDTQNTLDRLVHYLRSHRCLIILDNMETILQGSERAGQFRAGYEGYGELLRLVSESNHPSCVVLTSREKPAEVAAFEGVDFKVRSLQLSGSQQAAQAILQAKGLVGSTAQRQELCDRYSNSPLAIKIVSTSIQDLFEGDIDEFLKQDTAIFNGIRRLLDQQFDRLSPLEQTIMYWLAINREWTTIAELHEDIIPAVSKAKLLESLESLNWRSLVEKRSGSYTQQSVVMEYFTECLIEKVVRELELQELNLLSSHALIKTTVKDYIRETQVQLILDPITSQLHKTCFRTISDIEQQIKQMLLMLQRPEPKSFGYAAGNLINICNHLNVNLTGYDFSNLVIRHAYLQNSNLYRVRFIGSEFAKTIFMQTFSGIWAVTSSADGKLLATAETNGKVRLWHAEDLQPVLALEGHTSWARSVNFSPDGGILASSSDDNSIKLWEVATGKLLRTLQAHTSWVFSIHISPDARLLASGSDDQTIRLWDMRTGRLLRTLEGHDAPVRTVQFNCDGTLLASGGSNCVKLWSVETGELLQTLEGHTKWVTSIRFDPVANILASGSEDCTVRLWDVSTGQLLRVLKGHTKWVSSVRFDPTGNILASGSEDCTVQVWNPHTGELLRRMTNNFPIWCMSFSSKGEILVTGGEDHTLKMWDITTKKLIKTLHGHNAQVWSIEFSPGGTLLAGGSTDRVIRLWETDTDNSPSILGGYQGWVRCVRFSSDGKLLAGSSDDQTIKLWNVETGQLLHTLQGHSLWVFAVCFNPQGNLLATGSGDRIIKLWDIATAKCLANLQGHTGWIRCLSFSPDGTLLASGSSDHTINIWDVHSQKLVGSLTGHTSQIWSVSWSRQSDILASGSSDHTIKLWDTRTNKLLQTLQGHNAQVSSVCFNSDSTLLASGSADQSIKVWDVQQRKCLQTLKGHQNWVLSVAFNSQKQILASSSADETILFWDMQTWNRIHTLRAERPYEGMDITSVKGLTEAQKLTLKALGAVAEN